MSPVPSLDMLWGAQLQTDPPSAPQYTLHRAPTAPPSPPPASFLRPPGGAVPPSTPRGWEGIHDSALGSAGSFARCSSRRPGWVKAARSPPGWLIDFIGARSRSTLSAVPAQAQLGRAAIAALSVPGAAAGIGGVDWPALSHLSR